MVSKKQNGKGSSSAGSPRSSGGGGGRTVRLRPANPFDLICLIAQSQSDPRKAIAELIQNSLDAGAGRVTVTRRRRRGEMALSILDDGAGVFPQIERPEALERIATNIGHSFKRNLSPAERKQEMLLGKYGIGILGFWSLGAELEMRSRVAGSDVWSLHLVRNQPLAEVLRVPQRSVSLSDETWTEVIIRGVHPSAAKLLGGRRLGDYLGSELRGQLLDRPVKLRIVDGVARGNAIKDFLVVPERFRGRRLEDFTSLAVGGFSAARVEFYLVEAEVQARRPPAAALTCGGTVACEDISRLEGSDFARPPWSSGRIEGLIEFPDLEVAPATRRGIVPSPAFDALCESLRKIEPDLLRLLAEESERRRSEEDEDLAREIRRVFRPVAKNLPQYDFFDVREAGPGGPAGQAGPGPSTGDGALVGRTSGEDGTPPEAAPEGVELPEPATGEVVEEGDAPEPAPELLPPGPLAAVRIVPKRSRLLPGASRTLAAKAVDETGRRIAEGVEFVWRLRERVGSLAVAGDNGDKAVFTAPEGIGSAAIDVEARQDGRSAAAEASFEVVAKLAGENPEAGIPDPERIYDPDGDWRSRVLGRSWQYNAAHPDYQADVDDQRRRLRYFVHLFAKEIVLRNYGDPKDERHVERMVEVLTHIQAKGV